MDDISVLASEADLVRRLDLCLPLFPLGRSQVPIFLIEKAVEMLADEFVFIISGHGTEPIVDKGDDSALVHDRQGVVHPFYHALVVLFLRLFDFLYPF